MMNAWEPQTKKRSIACRGVVALLAVLWMTGCAGTGDLAVRHKNNPYTLEQEIEIGKNLRQKNIARMNEEGVAVNEDDKMVANLEALVKRIAAVSDIPDLPYTVTLFQCDIVNAAAAPGGAIMVYEGLYDTEEGLVRNNEELAAVIAHEIAHVTCRHGTESMAKAESAATTGAVLSTALGIFVGVVAGDMNLGSTAGDVAGDLYSVGANMWFPAYSRSQEYEADRISLKYMAKARIDPRAALALWQRAAEANEDEKTSIYASHPKDGDRFKHLQTYLPEALALYEAAGGDPQAPVLTAPLSAVGRP